MDNRLRARWKQLAPDAAARAALEQQWKDEGLSLTGWINGVPCFADDTTSELAQGMAEAQGPLNPPQPSESESAQFVDKPPIRSKKRRKKKDE